MTASRDYNLFLKFLYQLFFVDETDAFTFLGLPQSIREAFQMTLVFLCDCKITHMLLKILNANLDLILKLQHVLLKLLCTPLELLSISFHMFHNIG